MLYFRFPLSLRNVEDLLHERGIGQVPGPRSTDRNLFDGYIKRFYTLSSQENVAENSNFKRSSFRGAGQSVFEYLIRLA